MHRPSALHGTSPAMRYPSRPSSARNILKDGLAVLILPTQPRAIVRGDKGAKSRQTWMVRGPFLQIGENFPQGPACDGPIVSALPQHQPRVSDRPAHDFIYERVVHRGARCLSVGENTEQAANAAPFTSTRGSSRFGAGGVTASEQNARPRMDRAGQFGIAGLLGRAA
jgi:hypothetical protein